MHDRSPQPSNDEVIQSASRSGAPQSPPDGMVDPPHLQENPTGRKTNYLASNAS